MQVVRPQVAQNKTSRTFEKLSRKIAKVHFEDYWPLVRSTPAKSKGGLEYAANLRDVFALAAHGKAEAAALFVCARNCLMLTQTTKTSSRGRNN
jgi:hypothetical protein